MKLIANLTPLDQEASQNWDMPTRLLMETAGRCVAEKIHALAAGDTVIQICFVCGKGGNGGDGFVAARHLAVLRYTQLTVISLASANDLMGDAQTNFAMLAQHKAIRILSAEEDAVLSCIAQSNIVVDALFGSGLTRPLEGQAAKWVDAINQSTATCVAIDVPSGIDSATGKIMGCAVEADYTVTFAVPKPGLYLYPGKAAAGMVEIADIELPPSLVAADPSRQFLMTMADIKAMLPIRQEPSYKNKYGSVLIIAGSRDMPGAAVMVAEAALKAGAGLVTLASTASAIARMQLPHELMCLTLPETDAGGIAPEAIDLLVEKLKNVTTVAIGPGLTQEASSIALLEKLIYTLHYQFDGTVVIDADGLNCLSQLPKAKPLLPRFVLTPHVGECSRLTGLSSSAITEDLPAACTQAMQAYNTTVVLKTATTIVGNEGNLWINTTGNPGMATAGSGDVLTGMTAGFLAQGLTPEKAAQVAVYLHGLAGDKAAESLTQYCMTATDLIRFLPAAIQTVQAS